MQRIIGIYKNWRERKLRERIITEMIRQGAFEVDAVDGATASIKYIQGDESGWK